MNRRHFLKTSALGSVAVIATATATYTAIDGVPKQQLTLDAAIKRLDELVEQVLTASPSFEYPIIKHTGVWSPYEMFIHCAQSIEYSMVGFPEHKSPLFKRTVGKAAFFVFEHKGRMTHNLSEAIPGAQPITPEDDVLIALARLKQTFIKFKEYTKPLQPHFAYGQLTKREYEIAHVMHLNNHLEEVFI